MGKEATRAGIGAKLREYAGQLGSRDALIIYFAGHGQVIELPSHGRAGFLIPQDAMVDLDDTSNAEKWIDRAFDMQELVDFTREMKTHHVLLIADACCSGFMTKRGAFAGRKDLHLLLAEPSRVVLAAATENQGAGENWKTGHGYFTGAFLDQLAKPEAASVTDLFVEVRKQVSRQSKTMLPQMANVGEGDGEFVFIPLQVPEHDVKLALAGGLDHALKGVYERAIQRRTQKTRLADVYEAFQAIDYRFSTEPREREKVWQEKVERFEQNAQMGDALAMAGLHYCYSTGLGVEKDERMALRWARLAYDSGEPVGKHVYGRCLLKGIGMAKNEEAAWKLIEQAATDGFAISKLSIGSRHLSEMERTQRHDRDRFTAAHDLTSQAAEAGLAKAKEQLALLYLFVGELPGIQRDVERATRLLQAAAEDGLPSANAELGKVYLGEIPGTAKDSEKAKRYLSQAAEAGYAPAQCVLAEFYRQESPLGLQRDNDRARRLHELAAAQDFTPSMLALCQMYQDRNAFGPDPAKAQEYCERAAALNDPAAFVVQGTWYADGVIYQRDDFKAIEMFRRAASMDHPNGCMMLGWMFEQARGVDLQGHPRDEMEPYFRYHALHWYVQAVKLGDHPEAKKKLEEFHKECEAQRKTGFGGKVYRGRFAPTPLVILRKFHEQYAESTASSSKCSKPRQRSKSLRSLFQHLAERRCRTRARTTPAIVTLRCSR